MSTLFPDPADEAESDLLTGLNDPQRAAVVHAGTPLLIVAGAGSGKTRVLTHRVAHLIRARGVRPSELLAITFTNKAAGEMKERVAELIGPQAKSMWVSTFHSACVRILRSEADRLGYTKSFSIYDSADSQRLMTMVCRELDLDPKRYPPRSFSNQVSNFKNELIDYEAVAAQSTSHQEQTVAQAYALYQRRLRSANAMDFDDLIMLTVNLLQAFPEVLQSYRRRFGHILVDEYQDTNPAHYVLVHELVGPAVGPIPQAELCVVGDSDQSIYAFRGATIRNILQFEQDYPNATTIVLEQNYRSTQNILSAANAVISQNPNRPPKTLWSNAGAGAQIVGYVGDDEHDEARFVAEEIVELGRNEGIRPCDVAIFYRTNAASRVFEEVFIRSDMPYRVVGGVRFYERKEIRDALAYLRILANPQDEVSLRRILNVPKRGIGDKAQEAVETLSRRERVTFWEALRRCHEAPGLATRSRTQMQAFVELLDVLQILVESQTPPAEILEAVLDQTGYLSELRTSLDPQDETRIENLAELEAVAREFEETAANNDEPATLFEFLERVSLVADADSIPNGDDGGGVVTLMTLHTAKGLEFPVVFLTAMEDGVFPHIRSLDDPAELQEERRLAYVGLTRARQRLYLSRAVSRSTWGAPNYNLASRFLEEIPTELLDWRREAEVAHSDRWKAVPSRTPSVFAPAARRSSGQPVLDLAPGDRVTHDSFGLGTVVAVSGEGDRAQATVDFGSTGEKRLLLRYAPVQKL